MGYIDRIQNEVYDRVMKNHLKKLLKTKPEDIKVFTRPIDNHFRMSFEEYEYLKRLSQNTTVSSTIRQLFFRDGWESHLKDLRDTQKAILPPNIFYHSTDPRSK